MSRYAYFKTSRKSDSELHKKVREVLTSMFPITERYEEYPLDKVLEKGYRNQNIKDENQDQFLLSRARKLRCDFCLLKLATIIEVQGEHHYQIINYGKKDTLDKGKERFEHRKHLDKIKRLIYKEAGFNLVEIPYDKVRDKTNEEIESFIQDKM